MEPNVPTSYPRPISEDFGTSENTADKKITPSKAPPAASTILLGKTNLPSFNLAISHKNNAITVNTDTSANLLISTEILKNGKKNRGVNTPNNKIRKYEILSKLIFDSFLDVVFVDSIDMFYDLYNNSTFYYIN